ncbi:MAG: hypothetical protein R3B89_24720 [Polyangiaceae bacterium]
MGAQALLAYPTVTVAGSDFDLSLMNFAPICYLAAGLSVGG